MGSRPPSRKQLEFKPAIAELLRTCYCPPSLLLRVERVLENATSDSDTSGSHKRTSFKDAAGNAGKRVRRIHLGDGELMIQAVLSKPLRDIVRAGDIAQGSLLLLRRYRVAQADRLNGTGQVVYIAIEGLDVVRATAASSREVEIGSQEGGFIRDTEVYLEENIAIKRQATEELEHTPKHSASVMPVEVDLAHSSQESDGFETAHVEINIVSQRRQSMKELKRNTSQIETSHTSPRKRRRVAFEEKTPSAFTPTVNEAALESGPAITPTKSQAAPSRTQLQPPFHTLASLINPPTPLPARNYTCTVFATISWISPSINHKPPFPPKRLIKIHDPSLPPRHPGISLAVFVDARKFLPKTGTIALFSGVTMRRWEGEVILNAYASVKDRVSSWFVDDVEELRRLRLDVEGMRTCWHERLSNKGRQIVKC